MSKIISYFIFFHYLCTPAFADDASLFRKILLENSKIKTIDASIVQHIKTPEYANEVFKGRYRVNAAGNFRIDYSSPSAQIVVNDGRHLLWYYPDDRLVYQVGRDSLESRPKLTPLKEFDIREIQKRFDVLYLGEQVYGFLDFAHQFVVKDKKNGNTTDIYVDAKKLVVLSKITKDAEGREIIKEIYENYLKINNIFVPVKVNVYARTAAGTIRNTTEYSDIKLNYQIPDAIFRINIPPGVEKKYINSN